MNIEPNYVFIDNHGNQDASNKLRYAATNYEIGVSGVTPLMKAVSWSGMEEDIRTVLMLIQDGEDVDALNENNESSLEIAIKAFRFEHVISLIDAGADVIRKFSDGRLPILALINASFLIPDDSNTIVKKMIAGGAPVNAVDEHGVTPLMESVRMNNPKQVQTLIDSGADIFAKNHSGISVFEMKQTRMMSSILKKHAKYWKDHGHLVSSNSILLAPSEMSF
jgi:ankyrin repeat protein